MKITITGALGNISKPLAEILIKNGHHLTIISNDSQKAKEIEALGAKAAIGSVADVAFLTKAFKNGDAIYTMVPPNWGVTDYRQYIAQIGENYLQAVKASGVTRVVSLSSVGAHLSGGTGPIARLFDVEQKLNTLNNVDVRYLRPGLFYVNFLFDIGTIRKMGVMGNNYGSETKLLMTHPRDIAAAAAQELQESFQGKSHRYVVSDELPVAEVVKILGASIGNPALPWVQFSDDDTFAGMKAVGMSDAIAWVYVEMGRAINSGILFEDFNRQGKKDWGSTKLTDFAREFAAAYQSSK